MSVQVLDTTLQSREKVIPTPEITGERAAAKARNYLCKYVGISFGAGDPKLLQLDRLTWQVTVYFKLPYMQPYPVAFLDIDATTGDIIQFSDEEIEIHLSRARAYAKVNPSSTARRS